MFKFLSSLLWLLPFLANGQDLYIYGAVTAGVNDTARIEVSLIQKGKIRKTVVGTDAGFEFKDVPREDFTIITKAYGFREFNKVYTVKEFEASPAIIIELTDVHMRSRKVDYSDYDDCLAQITIAKDKMTVVRRLLRTIDKNFTPHDEEYVYGNMVAGGYYYMGGMVREGLVCYSNCIDAYEKYYPFERRNAYAIVGPELAEALYQSLAGIYVSMKLYESGIDYLEARKDKYLSSPQYMNRVTYFHFLCQAYAYMKRYDKAIENANQIKAMADSKVRLTAKMEAPVFASPEQLADSTLTEAQRNQFIAEQAKSDALIAKRDTITEAISRLYVLAYYHADIAAVYINQFDFKQLAYHDLEFQKVTKEQGILTAKLSATYENYSNPETAAQKKANAKLSGFQALSTGPNVSLIYALCKDNQPEEAKKQVKDEVDQAVWDFFTGHYAETEKEFTAYFEKLKQFENDPNLRTAVWSYYRANMQYYTRAFVLQGKLDKGLEYIRRDLGSDESVLQDGFTYYTESEKKELLRDYTRKLDYYLSVLLTATESDKTKIGELVNKVIQTKGLALECTQKQKKLLKKLNDPETGRQLEELKERRRKQASFNELFSKGHPELRDSLVVNATKISDLERRINLKSGQESLFSKAGWQDIQKKLKPGEVYVDIVRIDRDNFKFDATVIQYWALVIKQTDAPEIFLLGEGKAFESRGLIRYQNLIRAKLEDDESYKMYWSKINAATAGSRKLYFVSDGIYNLINPSSLQNPATGQFVLDEVDIQQVSSGRVLLDDEIPGIPPTSFALLGNPDFKMKRKTEEGKSGQSGVLELASYTPTGTRSGFLELPGTQEELDLIKRKAEDKKIQTLTLERSKATEQNVKQSMTGSVLHFATHGTFDHVIDEMDSYLKSKLVLAGAADPDPFTLADYEKYEDGLLSGYEVMQMNLSGTQLVVLSACETAVGDVESGEGVWGLQRAFQIAGASSVVGSLWTIDDQTTVLFMDLFYGSWLKGATLQLAYRTAMIETRKKYPHPYNWGAFTLLSR